jgi:hypothetical protein
MTLLYHCVVSRHDILAAQVGRFWVKLYSSRVDVDATVELGWLNQLSINEELCFAGEPIDIGTRGKQ